MSSLAKLLNIPEQNCVDAVFSLVKRLKVPANEATIKDELTTHPEYPTLLSVSDVLNNLKVRNVTIKATPDKLSELPLPFIAQIAVDNKEFFSTVHEVTHNKVSCTHEVTGKLRSISLDEFSKMWTGVAMLVEPAEQAGEREYEKVRKERGLNTAGLIGVAVIILGLWLATGVNHFLQGGTSALFPFLLLSAKLGGLVIALLLLGHDIDAHNPLMEKVCKASATVNCNAVLGSNAAKIGGLFSWSEAGFAYFAGGFLVALMSGLQPSVMSVLAWLNLLALPYVFFSVYYQWRIVKQWCVLCLATQGIFVLEFIVSYFGDLYNVSALQSLTGFEVAKWLLTALLPIAGWFLVKRYLLLPKEIATFKYTLARFKNDPYIFESMLAKQRTITASTDGLGVTLGNPDAPRKIVKVCNLYCGPCSGTHPDLEDIMTMNDDVQLQILFAVSEAEGDSRVPAARHLLAIAEHKPYDVLIQALHDWYSMPKKDYEAFAAKYPMNGELAKQQDKIAALYSWYLKMDIQHTPTFFYKGHELPATYGIGDLKYLLSTDAV
ncbi:thioredoxin domain-containing protein [Chitinophaga pendula]|uniref:cysteine peptidase family C39 domain-containing protein n=1 Tax=Chitinophaga TaxID=79328 RepID=UPI000BB0AA4A|nr:MULTISPECIES: cysteine peptidase family C39 domain-containing protein [Chitinophaga]ASZ12013.1 hypothetical protein CK934_14115 [Chitinophaga sp. MD30]UCJ04959.1 thioredoxin domain-containing protein [Chitinophaga pendula]